ncbi:hypothetical protein LWI28_020203 [Acer negundo]|uniref:Uncharacterized protein n=1 Tax=Acer negundo TaxID=4023 RepID=A0AAD5JBW1_ACENE|nr:hypothetical protein LWI28_020203 [Acer negundo]
MSIAFVTLYAIRLQNICTRTIHLDKAIDLNDVGGWDIRRQADGMGLNQFVTKPRGSSNEINEYYGTTPHDDLPYGLPKNNIFRLYDSTLAESLNREMDNKGLWDADHDLHQSKLERDLAF